MKTQVLSPYLKEMLTVRDLLTGRAFWPCKLKLRAALAVLDVPVWVRMSKGAHRLVLRCPTEIPLRSACLAAQPSAVSLPGRPAVCGDCAKFPGPPGPSFSVVSLVSSSPLPQSAQPQGPVVQVEVGGGGEPA